MEHAPAMACYAISDAWELWNEITFEFSLIDRVRTPEPKWMKWRNHKIVEVFNEGNQQRYE